MNDPPSGPQQDDQSGGDPSSKKFPRRLAQTLVASAYMITLTVIGEVIAEAVTRALF